MVQNYEILLVERFSNLPIICIGNIVVGGAGKTPGALKLGTLLKKNGYKPNFVSKGYGGIETNKYSCMRMAFGTK